MAARLSPPPAYQPGPISAGQGKDALSNSSNDAQKGRPQHLDLSLDAGARISGGPISPVQINRNPAAATPSSAQIETISHLRTPSGNGNFKLPEVGLPTPKSSKNTVSPPPPPQHNIRLIPGGNNFSRPKSPLSPPPRLRDPAGLGPAFSNPSSPQIIATDVSGASSHIPDLDTPPEPEPQSEPLQYFHARGVSDVSGNNQGSLDSRTRSSLGHLTSRPGSAMMLEPGRSPSPGVSPDRRRRSPAARPMSYVDLLNAPYPQAAPAAANLQNQANRPSVGLNASLLSSDKTFQMYLENVKKTSDLQVQYSFAVFLISMSQEARSDAGSRPGSATNGSDNSPMKQPQKLILEARKILEGLSGKSYPFAQYYLADGFTSGLFTKSGEPDNDRALPLFVAASKHGHAEAGYRAGLSYEFGWGTRRDGPKAWQYFRASASKGHPGAMIRLSRACLTGDLGQPIVQREGVRWLRRAADKADEQFNSAPYELGYLHEHGFGDDVFKDEEFTAQMYTKAATLGHSEAAWRMGEAYEHEMLKCPRDPALSVHFYNLAALGGHSDAMLGLTAWYLLGCEVLERDETEAFEWARRAAAEDNPKACFTVGWFRETGTGCRRDPLEANVFYVKAAEMGYERAKQRLQAINAAASGGNGRNNGNDKNGKVNKDGDNGKKKKKLGLF